MESPMKERPILFAGSMVKAILAGKKTATRRIVRLDGVVEPGDEDNVHVELHDGAWKAWDTEYEDEGHTVLRCPFGVPGDRLWVRETWAPFDWFQGVERDEPVDIAYRADLSAISHENENVHALDTYGANWERVKWKPSIFMPRWASRITLEVTEVRVERLQLISEEDAKAEGVTKPHECRDDVCPCDGLGRTYACEFMSLWDSINARRAPWASNPWVFVVSFRRVTP
jgi:hypothetical protein